MRTSVIQAQNTEALRRQLKEFRELEAARSRTPARLAMAFVSDRLLEQSVLQPFAEAGFQVFGSCSAEEIISGRVAPPSIVALLVDLPEDAFDLRIFQPADGVTTGTLGRALGRHMRDRFTDPVALVLLGGGNTGSPEEFLTGLAEILPERPVFGAVASSFGAYQQPPFFNAKRIYHAGVQALVLDRTKVDVQGVAISGWQELGTPKRITRSEGNKVLEIEGLPATTFYKNYFNLQTLDDGTSQTNIEPELLAASEYPILLRRADGSEVLRAAVQMDGAEQAVYYGGEIPQDSLVRFCSPNVVETIQHTAQEMQNFRSDSLADGADALLMFNCAVRSRSFGPYMNRELDVIQKLWGTPMVGFSSWGEIGQTPGQGCGFHNMVISIVALRDVTRGTDEVSTQHACQYSEMSADEVEALVEDPHYEVEPSLSELQNQLDQLRREKRILSHFLRLTSGDLEIEQRKSDELLLNILPGSIADRLKNGETVIADSVDVASVIFTDLVGFTRLSEQLSPAQLVAVLNDLFSRFDELSAEHGVEKIKTIGDAYMAVAGLPVPVPDHADRCLRLGRAMLAELALVADRHGIDRDLLRLRVGIHSGPLVAGVIGKRKFSYDLWGDTVNVASRMESHGEPGRIQLSAESYELLQSESREGYELRRDIEIKGKGRVDTYLASA